MKASQLHAIQFLCAHAIENLPDSVSVRRRILEGAIAALPAGDVMATQARILLHHMNCFETEQEQLALDFKTSLAAKDGI